MTSLAGAIAWGFRGLKSPANAADMTSPADRTQALLFVLSVAVIGAMTIMLGSLLVPLPMTGQFIEDAWKLFLKYAQFTLCLGFGIVSYSFILFIATRLFRFDVTFSEVRTGIVLSAFALSVYSVFGLALGLICYLLPSGWREKVLELIGNIVFISFFGILINYFARGSTRRFFLSGLVCFLSFAAVVISAVELSDYIGGYFAGSPK